MFNTELFHKSLDTNWLGHSFHHFEEISSTNTYAKFLNPNDVHGKLILADFQSTGRGQRNRQWKAASGDNLTFSIIFQPKEYDRLTLLTLVSAYAVKKCIEQLFEITIQLKWPNDIQYNNRKICGILTETQFSGIQLEKVIVGIGLNVNQMEFPNDLKDKASSLRKITGEKIETESLLAEILKHIEQCYEAWKDHDKNLLLQINKSIIGFGSWVKLSVNGEVADDEYKFIGVNEYGAFMALDKDLNVHTYSFEQVRVVL